MTIKAIAAHWNGACYSSDGEFFVEYETLQEAVDAAEGLVEIYSADADGNPTDVDLQWEIYDDGDDDVPVKIIRVDSQAAERAQEQCEIIASHVGEYATEHVGVDPDDQLVRWRVNGGHRGAHQGDQNRGGRDTMMMPEPMEPLDWLRLAVDLGCDDVDSLTDANVIDLAELEDDATCEVAYWLDAAGKKWELPCYSLDLGRMRLAWSDTDEAGIADEQLIDHSEWDGFAERLAEQLGELADAE